MELVLLQDVQSSFGSNWARVANTQGVNQIQIKDRFREQGFGPGAEELEVAGIDISPVGGFSRLFFNRGANATQPEVHRLGSVLIQLRADIGQVFREVYAPELAAGIGPEGIAADILSRASGAVTQTPEASALAEPKRRGRPAGSKNKPKELATAAGKAFGLD